MEMASVLKSPKTSYFLAQTHMYYTQKGYIAFEPVERDPEGK
jgi:hypothetical protein